MHVAGGLRRAASIRRRSTPSGRSARATRDARFDARHPDLLSLQRTVGNQTVTKLVQRKASAESDFSTAAKAMSRLGAGSEADLVEWYKTVAAAFSASSASFVKVAKHLTTLSRKNGAPLFHELLRVPQPELELYWVLASSLDTKLPRLANAVLLVRGYREPKQSGLEAGLEKIGPDLPAFMTSLAPDDVRKALGSLQLGRIFTMFQAAKGKDDVRRETAWALFDKLLQSPESDVDRFATELTNDERWALENYLYGEFTTKYSKGRLVRDLLHERFVLEIEGHARAPRSF
jgi:hypothetical protein